MARSGAIVFGREAHYNSCAMSIRKFWTIVWIIIILLVAGSVFLFVRLFPGGLSYSSGAPTAPDAAASAAIPAQALINDNYYVPQTFNNCGPAALSMDLSYYDIHVSQEALADILRPDHNSTGNNDEKSTPPEDIAAQAETYGLVAYYRPAGTIDLLKRLVAAGFPVMVRTLFMPTDQVAHYRVVKGYDDATATPEIIDEDGFQGPNVVYPDSDFLSLWKYYNYEYVVLATPDKQAALESILGADASSTAAWQDAKNIAENDLKTDPSDSLATFNLSVADYYLGDYSDAAAAYESVASLVPPNTLWYQIEPIETYYELGNYDKVFSLTESILAAGNPAFPELYLLRGESYVKEGNIPAAKNDFETALKYNPNLQSAKDALAALGGN